MPKAKPREPVGTTIGHLTLLEYVPVPEGSNKGHSPYARVKCSCGVEKVMSWKNIRNGSTLSCGHLKGIKNKYKAMDENGKLTVLYMRWNSLNTKFKKKGTKFHESIINNGIELEWNNYQEFCEDMAESFEELSKTNDPNNIVLYNHNDYGNYNKDNCYWGFKKVVFPVTIQGEEFNSLEEISKRFDLPISTLIGRAYIMGKKGNELVEV